MTRTRFPSGVTTFLDVLGWKGIYQRKADPLGTLSELIDLLEREKAGASVQVDIRSISDTIGIFSPCDDRVCGAAFKLHRRLAGRAICKSIASGIPVRGVTSYGNFQINETMFVGKAIDEAAGWFEQADWIGVHMTPSAAFRYAALSKMQRSPLWVDYKPPCKGLAPWTTPCVNWVRQWLQDGSNRLTLLQEFRNLGPIGPDIIGKFANTLAFFDWVAKPET